MKRKGYLLLYVVIIVGLIGLIALYTAERMRLSLLIEEKRVDSIREEIEISGLMNHMFQSDYLDQSESILLHHLAASKASLAETSYEIPLQFPDGTIHEAKAVIQKNLTGVIWHVASSISGSE